MTSPLLSSEHTFQPTPSPIYTYGPPPFPKVLITQKKFEEQKRKIRQAFKNNDVEDLKSIQEELINDLLIIEKVDGKEIGLWKLYSKTIQDIQDKLNDIVSNRIQAAINEADKTYIDTKNQYSFKDFEMLDQFIPVQKDILKHIEAHKKRITYYEAIFKQNSSIFLNYLIKIIKKAKLAQLSPEEYEAFKREAAHFENLGRELGMIPQNLPFIITPADLELENEQKEKKKQKSWFAFWK